MTSLEQFTMLFCHGGCVHSHVRNNCKKIGIFTRGLVQRVKKFTSLTETSPWVGKVLRVLDGKIFFFCLCSFLTIGNLGNTILLPLLQQHREGNGAANYELLGLCCDSLFLRVGGVFPIDRCSLL
ncbi:unnamed protein product [Ectocarpus sp. 12 AP-2014]